MVCIAIVNADWANVERFGHGRMSMQKARTGDTQGGFHAVKGPFRG